MEVCELDSSHRAEAVALWSDSGLTRPWNDPDADFDRAASGETSAVLGLFDPELCGTVMVGQDGHRGWVYYLAVAQARRRAGLGHRLMTEAETWLRRHGVVKVNLMVRHTNGEVVAFYERLGYDDAAVTVLGRWL